jgi:hypothetical protein
MKRLGGAFLLFSAASAAQSPGDQPMPPVSYPTIPREALTQAALVPQGWLVEAKDEGDLNGDKLPDVALVLHMDDPRNLVASDYSDVKYNSNPRMLVVAFGNRGGGYRLALADHKLIPRVENQNQDEPFDEVKIADGTLRVKMHLFLEAGGWRMGGSAYTFRWQDGAFRLIGFDRDSVVKSTGDTEEVSINYLTGRKELKTGNIGTTDEKKRNMQMPKKPLLTLEQVGDGLLFEPDEH